MLLLITGCINVNKDVPFTSITNFDERCKDYCLTIEWAINNSPFNDIVFCENSNYAFEVKKYELLAKKNNKRFEYLTFNGDTKKTIKCGKGYGEGEIVKYALKNSKLLKENNYFYKITGRLIISNIKSIVKDNKKNYFQNYHNLNEVDTRFYGINKQVFEEYLLDKYIEVEDNNKFYLEHVYYKYLNLNKVKYRTFYSKPNFVGKSGSTGVDYGSKGDKKVFNFIQKVLFYTNISNSKLYSKIRNILR